MWCAMTLPVPYLDEATNKTNTLVEVRLEFKCGACLVGQIMKSMSYGQVLNRTQVTGCSYNNPALLMLEARLSDYYLIRASGGAPAM